LPPDGSAADPGTPDVMADEAFEKALEGAREVEVTVTGRSSGREISRPLWFVRDGDRLYLVPITGSDSDWYKNVVKTPTVQLSAEGAQITAQARPVTDAAKVADILDRFGAKYGAGDVASYYSKHDAAVEVPLG
jgi:deazaflavin-dependent oxidoreductase (nitroreductase family)